MPRKYSLPGGTFGEWAIPQLDFTCVASMSKPIDPELFKQIEETKGNMPPEEYAKLRERAR